MEGRSVMKIMSIPSVFEDTRPVPKNFPEYFPWACKQFMFDFDVIMKVKYQGEGAPPFASRSRRKTSGPRSGIKNPDGDEEEIIPIKPVTFTAVYDTNNDLVQLRIERGKEKPAQLIKLLALIAKFQPNLTSLVILPNINQSVLFELTNLIESSRISEICLDGCYVKEGNYHCVLQVKSLQNLSLARCSINDVVVESMMSILASNEGASLSLLLLNLSSNFITNKGAISIGKMLRFNRKLCYLNLAGNQISDKGAAEIFNVLTDYPLEEHELYIYRLRKINFYREKEKLIAKFVSEQRKANSELQKNSRKAHKQQKKGDKLSSTSLKKTSGLFDDLDARAEAFVRAAVGVYDETISKVENGVAYSFGNYVLAYLNLSYNNLSYISIKKLLKIVQDQNEADKNPTGLLNIRLDGNNLPKCMELNIIGATLQSKRNDPKIMARSPRKSMSPNLNKPSF